MTVANTQFAEIKIADALNTTAEELTIRDDDWFAACVDACTVHFNGEPLDCYFDQSGLSLILGARDSRKVWARA